MSGEEDWVGPRPLRLATVLSFIPAFPLCLVHGVISHEPVPAIGLLPLAFSAAMGIVLCQSPQRRSRVSHPAAIFTADVVLAAGLMVVLVFTWIVSPHSRYWPPSNASLSMLAAYATMPLLVNFLIHLYLSLRALYIGLALDGFVRWLAWQAVPPDCPNCNQRLRPPMPSFPWFQRGGYAPLLVGGEEPFRDDEGEPSHADQPPVGEVVPKGKATAATAEEE